MNPPYFLSCLSGSEHALEDIAIDLSFLSCLSGSERFSGGPISAA